jgi:adenylate cyclase
VIYRFADSELDTERYELHCQGALRPVEPQVFDLLRYLLENRDRTVTKDDLYKAIWQGRFVSESALSSGIKAARQAVNDTGNDQRIIRTLHGRGFRFVAPVEVGAADRHEVDRPRGTKVSLAVLPFVNMSGDPEQEYFSDGITEDLITDLSRISGLFVPGRNSTFTYKGAAVNLQQMCEELGVRYVLEGSVRKAGGRVRIAAQLIDGESGGHLWADRYDRDLTDVLVVQDEITHRIVESLRLTLLPSEWKAIEKVPTENLKAYQFYLRGRQFFHRKTKNSLEIAKRMFLRAIEFDPNYARAHAGFADCESELYMSSYSDATQEKILAAGARALELDPDLAEAHASRGLALFSTLERDDEAEKEFQAAMELDPNVFEVLKFYARLCQAEGRYAEGAEYFERACAASPDDISCPILLAQAYKDLGRHREAEVALRRGLEKTERELQRHPEHAYAAALGATALARLGETARAKDWVSLALSLEPDDLMTQYNAACAYALMGEGRSGNQPAGAGASADPRPVADAGTERQRSRFPALSSAVSGAAVAAEVTGGAPWR